MKNRAIIIAVTLAASLFCRPALAALPPTERIAELSQWMTVIQVSSMLGTPDLARKDECETGDGIIVPCLVWDYVGDHADYRVMFDLSMPVAGLFKYHYVYGGP